MNYLLLYLEETYGLTSEKKIAAAIGIVANENGYHPIRDYLNGLSWDGTERIRTYTTVASIVNNLKRKGYVTAKRFGNTYQYTPSTRKRKRSFRRYLRAGARL